MKITQKRAKNLILVQQHYGDSLYIMLKVPSGLILLSNVHP